MKFNKAQAELFVGLMNEILGGKQIVTTHNVEGCDEPPSVRVNEHIKRIAVNEPTNADDGC